MNIRYKDKHGNKIFKSLSSHNDFYNHVQAGEARFDLLNGNSILYFQQAKTITEGARSDNVFQQSSYGYKRNDYGSISATTLAGQTINGIYVVVTGIILQNYYTTSFIVNLAGSFAKSFFTSVETSDFGVLTTESAQSFNNSLTDQTGSPYTVWGWVVDGGTIPWNYDINTTSWDGVGTQVVDFTI